VPTLVGVALSTPVLVRQWLAWKRGEGAVTAASG